MRDSLDIVELVMPMNDGEGLIEKQGMSCLGGRCLSIQ